MRAAARASLSYKWGAAALMTLVYGLVMSGVPIGLNKALTDGVGNLFQLVLLPMGYGLIVAYLDNIRSGESYRVNQLFVGVKEYWRVWGTLMLIYLYTSLWTLLLIVPGIIKSYSYAMTYYILRDEPDLKFNDAIEKSMRMMDGHKFDLFYLQLTFIGWGVLCILTLGIGIFWLVPYMQAAEVHFYEDVKAEYEAAQAQGE